MFALFLRLREKGITELFGTQHNLLLIHTIDVVRLPPSDRQTYFVRLPFTYGASIDVLQP
ncbi:MAG: hypothetical protein AAFX01_03115 [Cyanobacteria bacterium J06638_28]